MLNICIRGNNDTNVTTQLNIDNLVTKKTDVAHLKHFTSSSNCNASFIEPRKRNSVYYPHYHFTLKPSWYIQHQNAFKEPKHTFILSYQ